MPLVVLVGGSGFIGRYAAQRFARAGWRVRAAVRRPNQAIAMRTYGDVGQVEPVQANVRDDASVARAVSGADLVVYLPGVLAESGKQSFDAVQRDGAGRVAAAAAAAGVSAYVHVSAIGADAESDSNYARTKAEGEALTRKAMPSATVLRPSIVFGPEDQFFNRFAGMAKLSPVLPVVGPDTRFQPVYVNDVAEAIFQAGVRGETAGETYELGGPNVYTFRELMVYMLAVINRKRVIASLPFPIARMQAFFLDMIPYISFGLASNSLLTRDQVKMLRHDNVVAETALGFSDLDIQPTTIEAVVPSYLFRFRPYGQYDDEITRAAG